MRTALPMLNAAWNAVVESIPSVSNSTKVQRIHSPQDDVERVPQDDRLG